MKPIIFSTDMVRAILAGRKTQTRRIIPQNVVDRFVTSEQGQLLGSFQEKYGYYYPTVDDCRYKPGDVLWVRETWCPCATINGWLDDVSLYGYKADYDRVVPWKWKPSIHMPREAARLFLRVTDVRVEKLQDILCGDMKREGCIPPTVTGGQYQQWQRDYWIPLWDALNAKRGFGWDVNPWVWVIEFERTPSGAIGPEPDENA